MPRKHARKPYVAGGYYHIYNRGVNKQRIFFDPKDYYVFRRYARTAAAEMDNAVSFHAFALLENHFHLLVRQVGEHDITRFEKKFIGKYRYYISRKYFWKGHLFESSSKASYLPNERDITAVRNYILSNPIRAGLIGWKHVGLAP